MKNDYRKAEDKLREKNTRNRDPSSHLKFWNFHLLSDSDEMPSLNKHHHRS